LTELISVSSTIFAFFLGEAVYDGTLYSLKKRGHLENFGWRGGDGMAASRTAVLEKISRVPLVIYEAGNEYISVSYTLWCFVEID
jgi:hypothetical protein